MITPVNVIYFLFALSLFQSTYASFLANSIYSLLVFFLFSRTFSFAKTNFYLLFILFLVLSFLLSLSYLLSSHSLQIGLTDFLLSFRNFCIVLVSCFLADFIFVTSKPTVFFRLVTFVFLVNVFVVSLDHLTGIYIFSFLRPIVDTYGNQLDPLTGGGRPLGIFLNPNTSSYFSGIYLFFLFLVIRHWPARFTSFLLSVFFLSFVGSRSPLFIYQASVIFYLFASILLRKKSFSISRAFVLLSSFVFILCSVCLCFQFQLANVFHSQNIVQVVDLVFPMASNSARVILDQFFNLLPSYSIVYSCLLPSSYSIFNDSIEFIGLHGNEISLRYFLIAFSLPIASIICFWLFRITGVFSFFLAFSLLHYHIAFTPLLLVMCVLFHRYFLSNIRLAGNSLV